MEGIYDVRLNERNVGQVSVAREGLYYRFSCRCELKDEVCKLTAICNGREVKLGTLVPKGNYFYLETKVPVKRFLPGHPVFTVIPNRTVLSGRFVPIYPEEPFSYIEKLKNAYLARQNGQLGIIIQEKAGT